MGNFPSHAYFVVPGYQHNIVTYLLTYLQRYRLSGHYPRWLKAQQRRHPSPLLIYRRQPCSATDPCHAWRMDWCLRFTAF